jgi:hypothetical protein
LAEETSVENQAGWTQWIPPGDPRRMEDSTLIEDEHGRLIESADCGIRCPGCGICCAGYRDKTSADYAGVEEFEANANLVRGGLLKMGDGVWYRIPRCGEPCPGFGLCCRPCGLRDRPETVADARHVLLEDDASPLWQQHEALLILAHDGSAGAVRVLEAFMPRAHARVAGFAECALEEGRWWAETPRTPEEARIKMKREVLEKWDLCAVDAFSEIEEIEADLERLQYEVEIAQRLLDKAGDDATREIYQTQVNALQTLLGQTEGHLEAERQAMDWYDAMVAEMQADLGIDPMEEFSGGSETEIR